MPKYLITIACALLLPSCMTSVEDDDDSVVEQHVLGNTVALSCPATATGSAVGTYGGVAFQLACKKNKTKVVDLGDLTSFAYSARVGYEMGNEAGDCLMNGTGPDGPRACGQSGVTITFD